MNYCMLILLMLALPPSGYESGVCMCVCMYVCVTSIIIIGKDRCLVF